MMAARTQPASGSRLARVPVAAPKRAAGTIALGAAGAETSRRGLLREVSSTRLSLAAVTALVMAACSGGATESGDYEPPDPNGTPTILVYGGHVAELGSELGLQATTVAGVDSAYEWRTADELVATIDRHGVLTPIMAGETVVIVQGVDSLATADHPVIITDERQP